MTGATSGIGRASAQAFGLEGASLVLVGRQDAVLVEVAGAVRSSGGQAISCAVDLTAEEAPGQIVKAALDAYGQIDVLVNAAGVIASGALEATTEGLDWQQALDSGMLDLIREGRLAEAKERLQACLSSSSD